MYIYKYTYINMVGLTREPGPCHQLSAYAIYMHIFTYMYMYIYACMHIHYDNTVIKTL